MNRAALYFTAPGLIEIREEPLPPPLPGKVLVRTLLSAVSAGSELLAYRGLCPPDLPLDGTIPSLRGKCTFPMKYGYALVGRVTALGDGVPGEWQDRTVFSFHPHETAFAADIAELLPLPAGLSPEEALFLPNLETAVSLVMDGEPVIGEKAVVFGQGVVGLLTTALLAMHPLADLLAVDRHRPRREASLKAGARAVFDAADPDLAAALMDRLRDGEGREGADLAVEISGAPEALDQAISVTGFSGRIVIGSWYGIKPVRLDLGGRFHRSRIRMIASQVSTISPRFSGRWTKARRLGLAWSLLKKVDAARLVTQRFPFAHAREAYDFLDRQPERCLQVILQY
ncbi:MAG TPA: zinc-binding alcohol dehydrogenase [Syntrophales bacterium]|nr:zinc-binding alcohol dehydrogenase [Syntrophales bacterium]